jgi:outer membrane lipoprotein carrier protein
MPAFLNLLIFLLPAITGTANAKTIVHLLETRYRSARTLEAAFLERYSEGGRVVRVEAGMAYFRRPGKMRWEYQTPEKNLFLVDGKSAWFYVPADHTVTRVPAKDSTDWRTPLALLAGEMNVSRVCAGIQFASEEKPEAPDGAVLQCELRGPQPKHGKQDSPLASGNREEPVEAVFLEIAKNSGDLVRVVVRSPGGVAVEFRFTNWQTDPRLADSFFQFRVPSGVAIVNGEVPAGGGGINP